MKHPCIGCKYFEQCGNTNRTEECKGRETKKGVPNVPVKK